MSKPDPQNMHTWFDSPTSVSQLGVDPLHSRRTVNAFIDRWHSMGPVPGWKHVYGAMFKGSVIALVVLGRHYNPEHDEEGRLVITRYASREDRPPNTGSWLLSRVCNRCREDGYDEIVTFSGVCGNPGTVYKASNFTLVSESERSEDGWQNREDREQHDRFTRKKWVYEL